MGKRECGGGVGSWNARSVSRSGGRAGARASEGGPRRARETPAASAARVRCRAAGKISSARTIGRRDGRVVSARSARATTEPSSGVGSDAEIGDAAGKPRGPPSPRRTIVRGRPGQLLRDRRCRATRRSPRSGGGRGRCGEGQPSPRQGETGGARARAREHEANGQRRWLRATAAFILSGHRRGRAPAGISGVHAKRKFLSGSTGPVAVDILREKFLFSRRPRKFYKNPGPPCDGQFLSRPAGSRLFLHFKALKKRKC